MQKRKKLAKVKSKRTTKRALKAPTPWYYDKPRIGTLVEDHSDERGRFATIENAESFGHPIGAVAVVTRRAGSVFAEHRHADEGHTCMLVSGEAQYYERKFGARHIALVRMLPFQPVFTPPGADHAFLAVTDCVVVVVANIARDQRSYEKDVVRLQGDACLVTPEMRAVASRLRPIAEGATPEGAPV